MDTKLIAALACGAALALGACAGGSPAAPAAGGPSDPGTDGPSDPGADARTPAETFDAAQKAAQEGLAKARRTVTAAVDRANGAVTAEAKKAAQEEIKSARTELEDAVRAARALTAPAGDEERRYSAIGVAAQAGDDLAELTGALDRAADLFAWYGQGLARYTLGNREAQVPSLAGRGGVPHVKIERIERTIDTSASDDTQIPNPAAYKRDTFKYHTYSAGDMAFSNSGDVFKVDRYSRPQGGFWSYDVHANPNQNVAGMRLTDGSTLVGLKLTDAGLVIHVGTGPGTRAANNSLWFGDQADMRRNIARYATDADGDGSVDGTANNDPVGTNGWDLALTFGEPHTISVPVGDSSRNLRSSWMGNGDFHWRSIVLPDSRQLEGGEYYAANGFNHAKGFEAIGTYEVWLSNHVGTDTNREPVAGSGRDPYYIDDDPYYLKYAGYGLFVFTPDAAIFGTGNNGRLGHIFTLPFGYSAFADEDGQRTADISTAITSAKFHGHTVAYESSSQPTGTVAHKLLRGDVTLTVSIPKGTGTGTLEGTLSNFQRWREDYGYWTTYIDDFAVTLNNAGITADGTFTGTTAVAPAAAQSSFAGNGAGNYTGTIYGPRTDSSDLEIAGSWHAGPGGSTTLPVITGSFGAKQRPAPAN